jgi:hypothetical protein
VKEYRKDGEIQGTLTESFHFLKTQIPMAAATITDPTTIPAFLKLVLVSFESLFVCVGEGGGPVGPDVEVPVGLFPVPGLVCLPPPG